jgi:hypothetical protein
MIEAPKFSESLDSYKIFECGDVWVRWEDNIKMDLQEVGWGHGLD